MPACLLGPSTRATAELAEQVFGATLSHQTVSRLMRWLDERLVAWRRQTIEARYRVVYVDGMHVNVLGGDRTVMLAAGDAARAWADRWRAVAPWAVEQFMDGLEDSLMFYALPKSWWKRARTNNPLERLIETLRMRLTPMGCFHDPPAVERAVFGQCARWHWLGTCPQWLRRSAPEPACQTRIELSGVWHE